MERSRRRYNAGYACSLAPHDWAADIPPCAEHGLPVKQAQTLVISTFQPGHFTEGGQTVGLKHYGLFHIIPDIDSLDVSHTRHGCNK